MVTTATLVWLAVGAVKISSVGMLGTKVWPLGVTELPATQR